MSAESHATIRQAKINQIRALLAKAESTDYADEALAFFGKAQQLMSRYSLDEAMLAAGTPGRSAPVQATIWVDAPFDREKVELLSAIADANRCRLVSSDVQVWKRPDGSTQRRERRAKPHGAVVGRNAFLFGFATDTAHVVGLYTPLLVECDRELVAAARHPLAHDGRRVFKRAFMKGFTAGIGERLSAAARRAEAAAEAEANRVALVLVDREQAVSELVADTFAHLVEEPAWLGPADATLSAYLHGYAAGETASIGDPLPPGQPEQT